MEQKLIPVTMTYEQLYNLFGGTDENVPYSVNDEIFVKTPKSKFIRINSVVKKPKNKIVKMILSDNKTFECSEDHLFMSPSYESIKAKNAIEICTMDGIRSVNRIELDVEENLYDISIDAPHWYVGFNGIIHHNSFFVLNILKYFSKQHTKGLMVFHDTESAASKELFLNRGINTKNVLISEPTTVEKFTVNSIKILQEYMTLEDRPPMIMVLDSLGNLSTLKEIDEISNDTGVKDMTRASKLKAAFRVLRVEYLAKANVPLLVTNHIYSSMSLYSPKEMSGGSGLKYLSDTICFLSKTKDKNKDKEVIGNIITVTLNKSRLTRENIKVEVKLSYDKGLDRHHGLLDFAEKYGIIPRVGNQYQMPDGSKHFRKSIESEPEKYFDENLLKQINEKINIEFSYKLVE